MEPARKLSPAMTALIVIVLIGIVTTAMIVINNNKSDSTAETTTPSSQVSESPTSSESTTATSGYADGTYSATGSYSTPGGRESIDLTVVITDGQITSTSLQQNAKSGEAKEYQAAFASGYKELVVGKSVDEVRLSRVAGSSLTSNGFNAALEQIKSDAAA